MMPVDEADVRGALDGWRDELLDLTGANRLINLRPDAPGAPRDRRPVTEEHRRGAAPGRRLRLRSARTGSSPTPSPGRRWCCAPGRPSRDRRAGPAPARPAVPPGVPRPRRRHPAPRGRAAALAGRDRPGRTPARSCCSRSSIDGRPRCGPRADDPVVNPALALRLRRLGVELPVGRRPRRPRRDRALGHSSTWRSATTAGTPTRPSCCPGSPCTARRRTRTWPTTSERDRRAPDRPRAGHRRPRTGSSPSPPIPAREVDELRAARGRAAAARRRRRPARLRGRRGRRAAAS